MKRLHFFAIFLAVLFSYSAYGQSDPVVMKINGKDVHKSDFEYAYQKVNADLSGNKQSVDEFLESFIDFKLKIAEAESLQLDKDPLFVKEYTNYVEQVQKPYITDSVSAVTVARKIYDRLSQNIQLGQLFIGFGKDRILPKDTLKAYNEIAPIRELASKGDDDTFEELVTKYSQDSLSRTSNIPGYMGWKTALMFEDQIENAMYTTEIESVSQPVRTNNGYHIIRVFNKRRDMGQIDLAHIFFPFPYEHSTPTQKDSVHNQVEKVYNELLNGGDFANAAQMYSMDGQTAPRGGDLGWFGIGNPVPATFETTLFGLKEGEISQPIEMEYGFHIFKVKKKQPLLPWEIMKDKLIKAISENSRNKYVKDLQRQHLSKEFPYVINQSVYNQLETVARTYHIADTTYFEKIASLDDQLLVSVRNNEYRVIDFVQFLIENSGTDYTLSTDILSHKVNDFILAKQQETQRTSINDLYPELRLLTTEYYEGILLFNVMNKQIWSKAQNDTEGLQKVFEENRPKYNWQSPKYKGYVVHAKDKATLDQAKKIIKEQNNLFDNLDHILYEALNSDNTRNVYIEKGLWAKGENGFVDKSIFKTKNEKEIVGYPESVVAGKLLKQPETMDDVRGQVVSDYQTILEKEWMASLREKYSVVVFDSVVDSLK